jgi:NAD(P)-dependent dehydrogenase (short-subunit alcohol dehydrogenase family)
MVMTGSYRHREELVVVTGASTGIGAATAREFARRGFHVLAGVRRDVDAEALRADGIEPLILDITVDSDVVAIADRIAADPRRRPVRA